MTANKNKTVIVSCEAGGAQILSSWIKNICPNNDYIYCLQGPAEAIFHSKLGKLCQVELDSIRLLKVPLDRIITSTSWMPEHERSAIAFAREQGVYCISIIDHWTNYRERFLPNHFWKDIPDDWSRYLPNEIWVCDDYAFAMVKKLGFPMGKVVQIENPYLIEIKREFDKIKLCKNFLKKDICILYLSEPVADDVEKTYGNDNYWGYTEYDLIRSLVEEVNSFPKKGINLSWRIRLHPNETIGKYEAFIRGNPDISISPNSDLLDDLIWADAVVGGESMALVVALIIGKPVFSVIPQSERKQCSLPHKKIHSIKSFREVMEALILIYPLKLIRSMKGNDDETGH